MSCLNPEILFDIGKKLIEDGDSDAVIRFALSGKEPFETMKRVFSSVTTLELFKHFYVIGWDKKCSKFDVQNCHINCLMNFIGFSVTKLHLDKSQIPFYQTIMNKIIAKKQLITFSVGNNCKTSYLNQFLPKFSSTLKNVTIPNSKMTAIFRDSLNLESLTVLNPSDYRLPLFCCKTVTLQILSKPKDAFYNRMFRNTFIMEQNPNISFIKNLNFNESWFFSGTFDEIMKHFSSIESLKFEANTTMFGVPWYIVRAADVINHSLKVPSKVIFAFHKCGNNYKFPDLVICKHFCAELEYDESKPDFYGFTQMIQSGNPELTTLFEVQIFN